MSQTIGQPRQFRVRARHVDAHHARILSEETFEAAAVAYAEDLHVLGEEHAVSVIVVEIGTGHEHCFRIDLDAGTTAPCS